jgi:hypothetical protein
MMRAIIRHVKVGYERKWLISCQKAAGESNALEHPMTQAPHSALRETKIDAEKDRR